MTKIGIFGSGRVGSTLATGLAAAGHAVTFGLSDPSRVEATWKGPRIAFATPAAAALAADVLINATPGESSLERLTALKTELDGKILVDVSNATERGKDGGPGGLTYPGGSLAEHLQKALPGTRVVKTLNTMLFMVMANPGILKTQPTVFLSGDDPDAKTVVGGLLQDLGWPPQSIEDLGGVATAQGPEAVILLVPHFIRTHGFAPFALSIAR